MTLSPCEALMTALEAAAQQNNWPQVMQINAQLNLQLQQQKRTLNDATEDALTALRPRYLRVMAQGRARLETLRNQIKQHQTQRYGRQAYSLFDAENGGEE
ncbi:hypothetical protein N4G40_03520 [Pantoea eucrina]|uniref:Flagellar protein FliT n=1 Tax=Pantoea eucrina TaxID=472693 RepID=A0ABU5LBM8_9GAMM|nr:hypothetical protein [Pantoea eucrina]MDZ7277353.1 hypothetical protein [Pantoea eucrina]